MKLLTRFFALALLLLLSAFLHGCATQAQSKGYTQSSMQPLQNKPPVQQVTNSNETIRIVVIPDYVEEGADTAGGRYSGDYRRMMRFINNQLVRHNMEVVNPFAADNREQEFNRVLERAREDSALASMDMCKRYATDAAYIVTLNVKITPVDGLCKANARLDGGGYDAAGSDLGAGVSKTWKVSKENCDDAIAEVEKEVGDLVGRKLTAWSGRRTARPVAVSVPAAVAAPSQPEGGILQRQIQKKMNTIDIRLIGVTDYAIAEVFGKVLNTVSGVTSTRRYSSQIVPDNPQASSVVWRATIEGTDPVRLEANMVKMFNDILDNGGEIMLRGVPYRYTAAEVDLLKGLRPSGSTSMSIQFIVDRELARDREFAGRHDPYRAREQRASSPRGTGFE